jgi:F-type H+-transporting ATPase subunit epsilon
MAQLHFEFVSPERVLFSGDVDQVDLPGAEGDMGILAGHAPLVTALRPGIVTIYSGSTREPVVVVGGFAEVSPAGLTVLADTQDEAARDKLARRLDQLKSLQAALAQ